MRINDPRIDLKKLEEKLMKTSFGKFEELIKDSSIKLRIDDDFHYYIEFGNTSQKQLIELYYKLD